MDWTTYFQDQFKKLSARVDTLGGSFVRYVSQTLTDAQKAQARTNIGAGTLNQVYPIGSIYLSVNADNPGALFGGTWEQLKDRFLLGAGDTYIGGGTGGESSHSLTEAENGPHNHVTALWEGHCLDTGTGSLYYSRRSDLESSNLTSSSSGSGTAHNNMPPYLVVYMWKRTA